MRCPATSWSQLPSPHQHNGHHIPTHPSTVCLITASADTNRERTGEGDERGSARARDALVAVMMDDYEI